MFEVVGKMKRNRVFSIVVLSSGGLCVLLSLPARISVGDESDSVTRVEEDWQLVVNEPDADCESPQFHTVMAPFNNADGLYEQTLWNYREIEDDYVAGGLQIQSWNGEEMHRARNLEYGQLSIYEEVISWTQSLQVGGGYLTYSIYDGLSSTWGSFGKDLSLATDADLTNLEGYTPDFSVSNSCVTYGANRVSSLTITEVRYYHEGELLAVDSTDRIVYENPDD